MITLKLILGGKGLPGGYSGDEMAGVKRMQEFLSTGNAYMRLQGTRPQASHSLAHQLLSRLRSEKRHSHMHSQVSAPIAHSSPDFKQRTDSPIGLLAWIGEKLYAWTDNYPWTPEELVTWTML